MPRRYGSVELPAVPAPLSSGRMLDDALDFDFDLDADGALELDDLPSSQSMRGESPRSSRFEAPSASRYEAPPASSRQEAPASPRREAPTPPRHDAASIDRRASNAANARSGPTTATLQTPATPGPSPWAARRPAATNASPGTPAASRPWSAPASDARTSSSGVATADTHASLVAFAGFGEPPQRLFASPAYALRVIKRRRALRDALARARHHRTQDVGLYEASIRTADDAAVRRGVAVIVVMTVLAALFGLAVAQLVYGIV